MNRQCEKCLYGQYREKLVCCGVQDILWAWDDFIRTVLKSKRPERLCEHYHGNVEWAHEMCKTEKEQAHLQ